MLANEVLLRSANEDLLRNFRELLLGASLVGISMFSVAWWASTRARGVVIPAIISLVVNICVLIAVIRYATFQDWEIDEFYYQFKIHLFPCLIIMSVVSFITGWLTFVRRREP